MNIASKTIKQISVLTTVVTLALAANIAYGQWADPTTGPVGGNIAVPINTSSDRQDKEGDFGVENAYASTTNSILYCDENGENCFSPADVIAALNIEPVVTGNCQVRFDSSINGSQVDTYTLELGSNAGIGVWGHCDDTQNAYFTRTLRNERWGAAWNDHSEKAGTGYYTETQYDANFSRFSRDGDIRTTRFVVEEGNTASVSKSACGRTVRIGATVVSCTIDQP